MRREFLQLCGKYERGKHAISEWYLSEKIDGIRCYWDGGITTGIPAADVPWANVVKHGRLKDEVIATGLWTRYGQVIRAPADWRNRLPLIPLDGELSVGRGQWQETVSIVKSFASAERWDKVSYWVFDSPIYEDVFQDGEIKSANYTKTFEGFMPWVESRHPTSDGIKGSYYQIVNKLRTRLEHAGPAIWLPQTVLPLGYTSAENEVAAWLDQIVLDGGEGLVVRDPISGWTPKRHNKILKCKAWEDDEATVIGYVFGRETDMERSLTGNKTDKLVGLLGALKLRLDNGKEFSLSGFTDSERSFGSDAAFAFAASHPGEEAPADSLAHPLFPIGTKITFRYRELSDTGIPKEPRYWRKHE